MQRGGGGGRGPGWRGRGRGAGPGRGGGGRGRGGDYAPRGRGGWNPPDRDRDRGWNGNQDRNREDDRRNWRQDRRDDDRPQNEGQQPGAQDGPAPSQPRQYFLGYKRLQELDKLPPKDVLMYLNNSNNNFVAFLDDDETMKKLDCVELILQILLRSSDEKTMNEILNNVLTKFVKSRFLTNFTNLCLYMLQEKGHERQLKLNKILSGALQLTEKLMLRFPSLVLPHVIGLTANLDRMIPLLRSSTVIIDDGILNTHTRLKEDMEYHFRHAKVQTDEYRASNDDRPPPNNFRELSSTPTRDDLEVKEEPFLRANKAKGGYKDVDHYLDVQYRLLREDFIAPLRDGIEEYHGSSNRRRLNNVLMYENVRFVKPQCSPAGIVYVLQLDMNRVAQIRWQSSKRLIYGSLVCLSNDDFKTFIIATIQERKVEVLEAKGQVTVQLPDIETMNSMIGTCSFDANYVMLETTAYFESYRHVLKGLQVIQEDTMAFKEHFVFCSKDVAEPSYLKRNEGTRVDFTSILPEDATQRIKDAYKSVPVLDVTMWPTAEHLSLDISQWKALFNAITKRLSIIQGPPGTGKTYIGLKLAKFLLANYKIWADDGEAMRPILVVCYTNHALDQFLEGILKFSEPHEIVRVGGRSKSDVLEACMLRTLRKNVDKRAEHIRGTFQALRDNTEQLREAENEIHELALKTEGALKNILPATELEEFMTYEQQGQLGFDYDRGEDRMKEWLGFSKRDLKRILRLAYAEFAEEPTEDEPEIIEEAEAVEAERALDIDEEWAEILGIHEVTHDTDDDGDWGDLSREEKRVVRRKLTQQLSGTDIMDEGTAEAIRVPWRLTEDERWRLYRYWVKCYRAALNQRVEDQHSVYMELVRQRNEINNEKDATIMRDAKVIGMTTTGCAKYRQILARIQPKIVIVEEAAEVLEAHIITSLSESCQHLIMIGDHKQLRPNPAVFKLVKRFNLDISLFERMINNDLPFVCLRLQHRMRPDISSPMRFIYPELDDAESVKKFEDIRGVSTNMFYIDHGYPESSADRETRSHSNRHEAEFTIQLCRYLLQQGYSPQQVTVLTPYYGQLMAFKDYIREMHIQELKDVRITVVDNFQGEENDIILLSLVRSNSDGKIGFLGVDNRVCVALSRARMGFYVIGNFQLLRSVEMERKSQLWENLFNHMTRQRSIGEYLTLQCQIHYQDDGVQVSKASDFDRAPEGGCDKMCEFRLLCGHTCPRQCHIYDRDHIDMTQRCRQPCARNPCGNEEHACRKKCNEDCGPCQYPTQKILPRCGHRQAVKCGDNLDAVLCKQPCPMRLSCGHPCQAGCGRSCDIPCNVKVEKMLPCGHKQSIPCNKPADTAVCNEPCTGGPLLCEHLCGGTCQTCYKGLLHRNCTSKCERQLVCGHLCKEPCTKNCPPCPEKCENRCMHSKCQKKCGEACIPCTEKCAWICVHKRCSKLCHQLCDRERCNEPCKQPVPPRSHKGNKRPKSCGHPCIGLCGEPCPKICRLCDKDNDAFKIFFGDEDEETTRFVELSDCGHIISVDGLDHWMDLAQAPSSSTAIKVKRCPKCNKEIRQHLRYGNIIKASLKDVELAKDKIRGDLSENLADVQHIRQLVLRTGPVVNRTSRTAQMLHFLGVQGDRSADDVPYPSLKLLWDQIKGFMSGENPDKQTRGTVVAMRYKVDFMDQLVSMLQEFERVLQNEGIQRKEMEEYDVFIQDLEKVAGYLTFEGKKTRSGQERPRMTFSDQQLEDLEWFVARLKQFRKFLILATSLRRRGKTVQSLEDCRQILLRRLNYRQATMDKVKEYLKEMEKLCNVSGLGITDEERIQITRAIGLSKGHWYKCPNGHVYAIGECGGATQESNCNECGAKIGGTGHRLVGDNRLAGEMDGARYAAWSDQANMRNYDFD